LDSKDLEDQTARIQEYYEELSQGREELQLTQIEATKLAIEN
jgi:hypothetical protein